MNIFTLRYEYFTLNFICFHLSGTAWMRSLGDLVDDVVHRHDLVDHCFGEFMGRMQSFAGTTLKSMVYNCCSFL